MSSAPAPSSELTIACAPASAAATTTTMEKKKKITLKSFDNELFEVDEEVLLISQTIKNLIDGGCADTVIPLPNVNAKTLGKIIEYCKKHTNTHSDHSSESKPESSSSSSSPSAADSIQTWDAKFMQISTDDLYDVLLASNYLDIAPLLDLACQTTADLIKGKSPGEIRETFNIKNDFTPEEEAEIKKANQWAFEGI